MPFLEDTVCVHTLSKFYPKFSTCLKFLLCISSVFKERNKSYQVIYELQCLSYCVKCNEVVLLSEESKSRKYLVFLRFYLNVNDDKYPWNNQEQRDYLHSHKHTQLLKSCSPSFLNQITHWIEDKRINQIYTKRWILWKLKDEHF